MVTPSTPRLILLPGLDGTGLLFKPLLQALPADLPTQLVSYPTELHLTIDDLATLVLSETGSGERAIVLAESFSGLVCLEVLRRQPEAFAAVVFVACFAEPPMPIWLRLLRCLPELRLSPSSIPEFLIKRYCLGCDADADSIAMMREALAAVDSDVLLARLKELGVQQSLPGIIDQPCCYLQPQSDRLVSRDALRAFRAMSKQIKICPIEGPHFILQAQPELCSRAIVDFIEHRESGPEQ